MPTRLLLALAVVAGTFVPAAPQVEAARSGACTGSDGVTVVVDFGSLGGGTQVRCAPGSPSSGLDALSEAGFSYGFRPGFPGMVCTIDRKPDPCNGAPPDAYWAYHHAERGGGWTYSNQGAGSRKPPPGSVEGWAFGDDRRPSVAPPARPATTTTTTATSKPTTGATSPTPSGAAPAAPATQDGPPVSAEATSTTPVPVSPTSTTTPASTTTESTTETAEETSDDDAEVAADRTASTDAGGGAGTLLGLVLVVALVGAAAWELRRRRNTETGEP